jgi:hypothetical protein
MAALEHAYAYYNYLGKKKLKIIFVLKPYLCETCVQNATKTRNRQFIQVKENNNTIKETYLKEKKANA